MLATQSSPGIADTLLGWYAVHARRLPWRALPGEARTDAYRVWLSEIMLQQTRVAAAQPYFAAFTIRWPDIEALANAEEADVMAAWAGLGYYARARNLHACAKVIAGAHGGRFPENEAELLALPGIGAYTGAAIAAIAFGKPAVVIDANIERVIARLFAIDTPLPAGRAEIRIQATAIVPPHRAGDFAQAMMDLGATICTARNPACAICPLLGHCLAARTSDPEAFPVRIAKPIKPQRSGTAFWIAQGDKVLLVRRPRDGLLGGMRALPTGPWRSETSEPTRPAVDAAWRRVGTVRHVFTHFSLSLEVEAAIVSARPALPGEWWPIADIEQAGLPTLFAKAAMLGRAAIANGSAAP